MRWAADSPTRTSASGRSKYKHGLSLIKVEQGSQIARGSGVCWVGALVLVLVLMN